MDDSKNLQSYASRPAVSPDHRRNAAGTANNSSSCGLLPEVVTRPAPLHICAISNLPHSDPVMAPGGAIFEASIAVPLVRQSGVHPLNPRLPLSVESLVSLRFSKRTDLGHRRPPLASVSDPNENVYQCPALHTPFTSATVVVAVAPPGCRVAHVYSWRGIQQMNIASGRFIDLVDRQTPFCLSDVVVLQGDMPPALRALSSDEPPTVRSSMQPQPSASAGDGNLTLPPVQAVISSGLGRANHAVSSTLSASASHGPVSHRAGVPGPRAPRQMNGGGVVLCGDASRILSRAGVKRSEAPGYESPSIAIAPLSGGQRPKSTAPPHSAARGAPMSGQAHRKKPRIEDHRQDARSEAVCAVSPSRVASMVSSRHRASSASEVRSAAYKKIRKGRKGKGYVRVHTGDGQLNIELHCDKVPATCDNFLQLARRGFYNGLSWHRVIPGAAAETGDPTGSGRGGESAWGAPVKDEVRSSLSHDAAGIVSVVKSSGGALSQWRLCFAPLPDLDGHCTVFGKVVGDSSSLLEIERCGRDGRPCSIELVEVLVDPIEQIRKEMGREVGGSSCNLQPFLQVDAAPGRESPADLAPRDAKSQAGQVAGLRGSGTTRGSNGVGDFAR